MQKDYELGLTLDKSKKDLSLDKLLPIETLLRLNPHWIIESVESGGAGYEAQVKDHVSGEEFSLEGRLSQDGGHKITIVLNHDTFSAIDLFVEDEQLKALVSYSCGEEELTEEQERFMVLWLRSIKEYLRLYATESLNTRAFRFLMNRVILKMTPSQRKISLMLIRITVVEILVILLIVVGYVIFVLK